MIDILKKFLEQTSNKILYTELKKHTTLHEWILNETKNYDVRMPERIYIILHGKPPVCTLGNVRLFKTLKDGYKFCGHYCECYRESRNTKMNRYFENQTPEDWQRKTDKTKQTNIIRYGVENPAQSEEIKTKIKETNLLRYGTENPFGNVVIKEKLSQTFKERYGVSRPIQNEEIKDKIYQTNLKRYNVQYVSQHDEIKRKIQQSNIETYFKNSNEINEAKKQTNIKKFGTEYAIQNYEIKEKQKKTFIERYGVECSLQNSDVKKRTKQTNNKKYNRNDHHQIHISNHSYEILLSETKFKEMMEIYSLAETADILNVSYPTIQKYCQKYNIDLPSSTYETAIIAFLSSHDIAYQLHNRKLISPLEIDIVLPDYKIGIEFCGLYWHSECIQSDKKYHLNKLRQMNSIGYRLITIFEDEWLFKRDIVERRLLNFIGLSEKGKGARKLTIKQIDWNEAKQFLDTYHIQGAGTSGYVRYGAYDGTDIVAVMTFSKPRLALGKKKDSDVFDELLRFATNGKNYPGVASKLLATFIKEYDPVQIISYADRRWSEGNLYKQLGFILDKDTDDVNYWHVKGRQRYHRFNFRKDKIKHLFENKTMTEREMMTELGYSRIWDCGTLKFIWNKK